MGGKSSKKQTVGYHYKWAMHLAWCRNADALLEVRAGGVTAWEGRVTDNTVLSIDKPDLWGGEKGEGGVVGALEVLFGGPAQAASSYLASVFGPKQSGNRGKVTTVFQGGRFGAFVPNPKPLSAKFERIHAGWEGDEAWYPETAAVQLIVPSSLALYIAMDTSGSMAEETSNGSTRLENMQAAVNAALDFVRDAVIGAGAAVDVSVVAWADGHSATTYYGADAADIAAVQAWVDGRSASGGTDFREAFEDLATFAGASSADRKIAIFVTDGAPNAPEAEVAGEARAMVQAVGDVDVFAANIDRVSTTYTAYVDTTPADGVPVVSGGEPAKLTNMIVSSIASGLVGMNPAHMIYEAITHPEMMGEPVGLVNAASFEAAADKLYAEGFGLCAEYDSDQETPEQFIQRICNVIGGSCSQSRIDGKYYLDLIRDDYVLEDLPVFTEDDILEWEHTPSVNTEAVNCVRVAWRDPQAKEDRTTAPVYAMGRIRDAGEVIAEVRTYREIPIETLALRVARRDVDASSAPVSRFRLTVRRKHRSLRLGQAFRLQAPSRGIADMVCRLGDIGHGTHLDGRVRIVAVQDVFALPDTVHTGATPGEWVPPDSTPAPAVAERVFEAPYVELAGSLATADLQALEDDAGFLQTVAAIPAGGVNYAIATASTGEEAEVRASADWCPTAQIAEGASHLDTEFTLTAGSLLDRVTVGSWALWDDEIVRVDAIDSTAGTLTLGRGCADTVPVPHDAAARIWFCGDWTGTDLREYVDAETVSAWLLSRTGSGQLPLTSAAELTVTFGQRQARPYAPGLFQINGAAYPSQVYGALTVSWAHRDRVLQADQLVDTTMASVGPEAGTSYEVRFYLEGVLTHTETGLTSTSVTWDPGADVEVRVELEAQRDGLASWQVHSHEFLRGAPLWTPADMATPAAIILNDQSSLVESSGAVSSISNLGELGADGDFSQATATARPVVNATGLNGMRTMQFDGTDDTLQCNTLAGRSVFKAVGSGFVALVYRKVSSDGTPIDRTAFSISRGTSTAIRLRALVGNASAANTPEMGVRRLDADAGWLLDGTTSPGTDWAMVLYHMDWTSDDAAIWLDGVMDAQNMALTGSTGSTENTVAQAPLFLGGQTNNSAHADIEVAELVVGTAITTTEIDQLFGYLAHRWGLSASLPPAHPYATESPKFIWEAGSYPSGWVLETQTAASWAITESGRAAECTGAGTTNWRKIRLALPKASGKHFLLVEIVSHAGNSVALGVAPAGTATTTAEGSTANAGDGGRRQYFSSGQKRQGGIYAAYGAAFTTGDKVGIAYDADAGEIEMFKNGVSQGVMYTGVPDNCEPHMAIYGTGSKFRVVMPLSLPSGYALWI